MKKNVGDFEAIVRGVMGAGALALAVGQRNPIWLAVSLLHFATATARYCPLNAAFDIDSYNTSERAGRNRLQAVPTIH